MRLLFKVEDMFDVPGRGCVIVPVIPDGSDVKVRAADLIQLRAPDGRVSDTHIASIELLKPQHGNRRMAIMLPRDLAKRDIPVGTEVWHLSNNLVTG
jgi:hypothetical protein